MSIKATLAAIRALPGMTARHDGDEYRVTYTADHIRDRSHAARVSTNLQFIQRRAEDVSCYTPDAEDALLTARSMAATGYRA